MRRWCSSVVSPLGFGGEQFTEVFGQDSEPLIGNPQPNQPCGEGGHLDLQLRVAGQQPLPVVKICASRHEFSKAGSAVTHQHPAALGVHRDNVWHPARCNSASNPVSAASKR